MSFYLYVVCIETKFIFDGNSYTFCREFWYKLMDIFSTGCGLLLVMYSDEEDINKDISILL